MSGHTYIRTGSLGQEHGIRISVPFMRDTTRARARKYGENAGLSPSSTHVRQ